MKIYYHIDLDIMCIVNKNGEIQKFIGDFCNDSLLQLVFCSNIWYKADSHPDESLGYEFLGEL